MRGFEYLDIYNSSFKAGERGSEEMAATAEVPVAESMQDDDYFEEQSDKLTWAEKFKKNLSRMFETEDQRIN